MGVETAMIVAAAASVAAGGYSVYAGERQSSQAKKAQRRQSEAIAQEKAMELTKRKDQIKAQREQMGGTGASTKGTSGLGVSNSVSVDKGVLG